MDDVIQSEKLNTQLFFDKLEFEISGDQSEWWMKKMEVFKCHLDLL